MENKKSRVVIIILTVIIIGLISYIIYGTLSKSEESTKEKTTINKTESETKEVNTISKEEAIKIAKDLYVKTQNLYLGEPYELSSNADNLYDGETSYEIENGIAKVSDGSGENPTYIKYTDEVSKNIIALFTTSGLKKFLSDNEKYNKNMIVKDNNNNFYRNEMLSASGGPTLEKTEMKVTSLKESVITFSVMDTYKYVDYSENDKETEENKTITVPFKIVKENGTWRVEDYQDSYNKYLGIQ